MVPAASPRYSMENPRPQLSLVELRQLRWFLGGLLGLLSAWTVFYMEVDALLALVFITATVPLFTFFPRLSRALPPVFHLLAFPVIVVVFALDIWSTREPLPAMIRLDLMLLCYRCLATRGRREDLQLILLALFLVVVTGVFTVSIAFVAQILLFTAAALGLLFAVTLSDAHSEGGGNDAKGSAASTLDAGWEQVNWSELAGRLRQAADLRVVALGGALFAGVVGLSAVLFLALPRFEISNDFFLDRLITKSTRTGFSDNVTFEEVVDIQKDNSVAIMVDVSDPASVPAEPYWRMLVLDEYSGQGFRMSAALKDTLVSGDEKLHVHTGRGRAREDSTVWTVYFQPGVSKFLPLMGGFGRLTFGEPQALKQSPALRIAMLPVEPAKMVAYRVEGMDVDGILGDRNFARDHVIHVPRSPWRLRRAEERWSDLGYEEVEPRDVTFLGLGLEREADVEQLHAWAAEIGGAGKGGEDFARRAGAWLQARHDYSLSMRLSPAEGDPLVRWLASSQPGHCELFAGSLVLLARAAGVPARLVTGFKGGVWNSTSGSITVRNSDAHAWAEIWDEEMGSWLRADATPGSVITPSPADGRRAGAAALEQDRGWGARLDGLRIFWYRRIVNFDQGSQLELMRGTKESLRTLLQSVRKMAEQSLRSVLEWARAPWGISRYAGVLITVVGVGMAVQTWRRFGRAWWLAWRSRRAGSHRRDPVRIEASRWLARLERADKAAQGAGGEAGERVQAVRARLLRLRFGAREGWAPPHTVFREARQAVRDLAREKRRPTLKVDAPA